MPGDRKNPVDGRIVVAFGKLQAEGVLAGLTVAQAREMLLRDVKEFAAMPPDAVGRVVTMDPDDDAWKQVPAAEEETIMTLPAGWGLQIFQAVSKDVPDAYVIRKSDIFLIFRERTE